MQQSPTEPPSILPANGLIEAVKNGNKDMVENILGANNITDPSEGYQLLKIAAYNGYPEIVKLLQSKNADVNAKDKHGRSILHHAVENRHIQAVRILLEAQAAVNEIDDLRKTPLIVAASRDYVEIIQMLLLKGADVSIQDQSGKTALHHAAYKGFVGVVEMLLRRILEISTLDPSAQHRLLNIQDADEATPLYWAVSKGHEQIVHMLLIVGADINIASSKQKPMLIVAIQQKYDGIAKMLIANTTNLADIETKDANGLTPVYAADNGRDEVVTALLAANVDKEVRNNKGATPLFAAASKGRHKVVEILLDAGSDKEATNNNGETPLFAAASKGHSTVFNFLIDKKANITTVNNYGQGLWYAAIKGEHPDIVATLVSKCIRIEAPAIEILSTKQSEPFKNRRRRQVFETMIDSKLMENCTNNSSASRTRSFIADAIGYLGTQFQDFFYSFKTNPYESNYIEAKELGAFNNSLHEYRGHIGEKSQNFHNDLIGSYEHNHYQTVLERLGNASNTSFNSESVNSTNHVLVWMHYLFSFNKEYRKNIQQLNRSNDMPSIR